MTIKKCIANFQLNASIFNWFNLVDSLLELVALVVVLELKASVVVVLEIVKLFRVSNLHKSQK